VEDGLPMVDVENGFLMGGDRCISACDRDEDGGMVVGWWGEECVEGFVSWFLGG